MSNYSTGRRGRHRKVNKNSKVRKGAVAAGATLALGVTFTPAVANANPLAGGGIELGNIMDLLENEMILDYIRVCQSGDEAPQINEDSELVAVADCSQSTGTGIGVVLPESIEVGGAAESITIDLGDDINVLGLRYELGERNLIELVSAAALGSGTIKNIAGGLAGVKVDPRYLGEYTSYEEVQRDAALPVANRTERYCDGAELFGRCLGTWRERTVDDNLEKRTNALKVAEYLTGDKYNYNEPVELPGQPAPRGSATTIGDGIQIAAAMRGGNAVAEAQQLFGLPAIALAGADKERSSVAFSRLGIATALNMDTDEIKLTWFGKEIDFGNLRDSVTNDEFSDQLDEMVDPIEGIEIPGLKEVSCFGVVAQAEAEGLGACSNILGTFDYYEDLREARPGESRQTQYGLTDITSLVMGNDALVKQLTGDSENTPFLDDLMHNLTSEDDRLKFANDFVRFTQNVATEYVMEPVLDEEGTPLVDEETGEPVMQPKAKMVPAVDEETGDPIMEDVLDDEGNQVMVPQLDAEGNEVIDEETGEVVMIPERRQALVQETDEDGEPVFETFTTTAAWLTSDYGLREPVTVEWLGHAVTFFPAVDINGTTRPNLIGLPEIKKIQEDADSGLLPKVSLVQWDRAFGRGTITLDDISNPGKIFRDWRETVTTREDLEWLGRQLGMGELDEAVDEAEESGDGTTPPESTPADPGEDSDDSAGVQSASRNDDSSDESDDPNTDASDTATDTPDDSTDNASTPVAPSPEPTEDETPEDPAPSAPSAPEVEQNNEQDTEPAPEAAAPADDAESAETVDAES